MKLRIIGGALKRRAITVKERQAGFRPTLERTREAVVESVKTRIPGAAVADLCAGSGAMGLELLSRGARSVHFVESHRGRAGCIGTLARQLGVEQRCRVFATDVGRFLRHTPHTYDIIYFDPPYDVEELAVLLPEVVTHLSEDGLCLYEHRKGDGFELFVDRLEGMQTRHRLYGRTRVDFITRIALPVQDRDTASRGSENR